MDRVVVENAVSRPQYFEYIALNPQGLQGSMYGGGGCDGKAQSANRDRLLENTRNITGHFNSGFGSQVIGNCAPGDMGFAMYQQQAREKWAAAAAMHTQHLRSGAGFQ